MTAVWFHSALWYCTSTRQQTTPLLQRHQQNMEELRSSLVLSSEVFGTSPLPCFLFFLGRTCSHRVKGKHTPVTHAASFLQNLDYYSVKVNCSSDLERLQQKQTDFNPAYRQNMLKMGLLKPETAFRGSAFLLQPCSPFLPGNELETRKTNICIGLAFLLVWWPHSSWNGDPEMTCSHWRRESTLNPDSSAFTAEFTLFSGDQVHTCSYSPQLGSWSLIWTSQSSSWSVCSAD